MATYELVQLDWIATGPEWLECERPLFYSTVDVQTTGATPIYAVDIIVNAESRHSSRVLVVEPNVVRKWVSRTPPPPYDHICGADALISEWSKRDGTDVETTAIAMLAEDGADPGHCLAALSFVFHAGMWAQLIQITHCDVSYVARVMYSPTGGGPVRMRIASGVTFADMDIESLRVETSLFHREVHARSINPCSFAEDFATWLRQQLGDLTPEGYKLSEPIQQDHGWGFRVRRRRDTYWVALSFCGESLTKARGRCLVSVAHDPGLNLLK